MRKKKLEKEIDKERYKQRQNQGKKWTYRDRNKQKKCIHGKGEEKENY
jgi:hypothetical protein